MYDGPTKEKMLAEIKPGMKLKKEFFKGIYGYEISFPGFADQAIAALEAAGCSKAREYYNDWVSEYEAAYKAQMVEVSKWYSAECERQWKKKLEERTKEERSEIKLIKMKQSLMKRALLLDPQMTLLTDFLRKQENN